MAQGEGELKCIRKTRERRSVLHRDAAYRQRCEARGAGFTDAEGAWEAHHILCNHAIEGRKVPRANRHYVEDCLWITDWDLNNPKNLIGLPLNRQYRESDGEVPQNLCSHQVDHNTKSGYTWECQVWLRHNVWDTLKDRRRNHDVEARNIKALLEQGTQLFADRLARRGKRRKGTKYCWKRRFRSHRDHVPQWYFPFSMAGAPTPRSPGVSWNRLSSIFRQLKPQRVR